MGMIRKGFFAVAAGAILLGAAASFAAVTGRVVDASGNPVIDAMVSYTSVDNRLVYTYTCTDGKFSLAAPTEWSVKNPKIYNCSGSGVIGQGQLDKKFAPSPVSFSVEGGLVKLYVNGTQKVSVSLYSLAGKKINSVFSGNLTRGAYQFNPFTSKRTPYQTYIVKVENGSSIQSKTLVFTGNFGKGTMSAMAQSIPLTKKLAAVDTIRAGKTGYTPVKLELSAFTADVGDLKITARDIEAEVTAAMTNKSTAWKAQQVTQVTDWTFVNTYGTMFWGAGNTGAYTSNADKDDDWQAKTIAAVGQPKLIAVDAVHGFSTPPGGTIFPHNINLGSSRNYNLIELEERITAIELRAMGINWAFAPCVDIPRNERHGRTYEGFDEGPDGNLPCTRAAIRGFQGTDLSNPFCAAATAKHYAGAGGTANGTHGGDATTGTDSVLRQIHLPQYKLAADLGCATVMAAFNSWLGTPMHNNKVLLTDVLKTQYKFDGFIVGDYDAANSFLQSSFQNGVDNIMAPDNIAGAYNAAYNTGGARLDDACKRVLRVKYRMDLLNNYKANRALLPTIGSALHKSVARELVRRSVVLLKNDGAVLPLKPNAKIHVIGDWANSMSLQCGGWTLGWPTGATATTPAGTNIKNAITAAAAGGTVTFASTGTGIPASAEVVVVVCGEQPYAETGGDAGPPSTGNQPIDYDNDTRTNPATCRALFDAAKASGKPVVGILCTGRPLIITNQIAKCNAFVCAWLIGTEGDGLADILFNVNGEKPTGKLPCTWPISYAQIPINTPNPASGQPYGDVVGTGGTPLFPYGFGLSYP
jgi:beta-glucosidase